MSEIPKTYEPQSVEAKWYQFWLEKKFFAANPASPKPAYSITHRSAHRLMPRMTALEERASWAKVPAVLAAALRA